MKIKPILFFLVPFLMLSACVSPAPAVTPPSPITVPSRNTPTVLASTDIPSPTAIQTTLPSPTPGGGSSDPTLALDAIYSDHFAGYSLRYPSSWRVIDVADAIKPKSYVYTVSLVSFPEVTPSKAGGRPPGSSAVDINVFSFQARTLDGALAEFQTMIARNEPPETIAGQETWKLESGIPAYHFWIVSGADRVPALLAVVKDKTLVITGYGNESVYNAIVKSLQ